MAWGALLFAPMLRAESLEREVEARWGKSFPHLVWTHRCATFTEKSRVAARLGCGVKEYEVAVLPASRTLPESSAVFVLVYAMALAASSCVCLQV